MIGEDLLTDMLWPRVWNPSKHWRSSKSGSRSNLALSRVLMSLQCDGSIKGIPSPQAEDASPSSSSATLQKDGEGGKKRRKVYLALSWSGSCCCGWAQNELLVMLQLIKPQTLWNTIKEKMSLWCMCFPLSDSHYLRTTGVCTNPAPTQLFIHPLKKVKSTSHRRLN